MARVCVFICRKDRECVTICLSMWWGCIALIVVDISLRYLSHKSVSWSPVAVQATSGTGPDVITVKQWPLYHDRSGQRHSCITGSSQRCCCNWGLRRWLTECCRSAADSLGVVWEVAALLAWLLDYLQQGVVRALLYFLVSCVTRRTGKQKETEKSK